MMANRERKRVSAESNPPINFTCGLCRKVHPYVGSYDCPDAEVPNEEV